METTTMQEITRYAAPTQLATVLPTLPFAKPAPRFFTSAITDDELDTYLLRMPDRLMHEMATRFALAGGE